MCMDGNIFKNRREKDINEATKSPKIYVQINRFIT